MGTGVRLSTQDRLLRQCGAVPRNWVLQWKCSASSVPGCASDLDALGLPDDDPRRTAVTTNQLNDQPLMRTTCSPAWPRSTQRLAGSESLTCKWAGFPVISPEVSAPVAAAGSRPPEPVIQEMLSARFGSRKHLGLCCAVIGRRPVGGVRPDPSTGPDVSDWPRRSQMPWVSRWRSNPTFTPWHRSPHARAFGRQGCGRAGHAGELHPDVVGALRACLPAVHAAELDLRIVLG